jgi:hypothetical protein
LRQRQFFILATGAACFAQASPDIKQMQTKMVCSAYSSNPQKQPAFQIELPFTLSDGLITAERATISSPGNEHFKGVIAPSGDILSIRPGTMSDGSGHWVYEFHGRYDAKGTSVLKGGLHSTIGAIGSRTCTISF